MTALPESISNLKYLTYLNLDWNKFTILPASIWPLENLKTLELSENPWEEEWKEIYFERRRYIGKSYQCIEARKSIRAT